MNKIAKEFMLGLSAHHIGLTLDMDVHEVDDQIRKYIQRLQAAARLNYPAIDFSEPGSEYTAVFESKPGEALRMLQQYPPQKFIIEESENQPDIYNVYGPMRNGKGDHVAGGLSRYAADSVCRKRNNEYMGGE